jgi:hypothetical protein
MNLILKHIIEGKIEREVEVTRRQGRRHKQLLDDLKWTREYCKLKEEALDRASPILSFAVTAVDLILKKVFLTLAFLFRVDESVGVTSEPSL